MHHAYPRECPYPHLSGTTVQERASDWTDGNGGDSVASEEDLLQFTANATSPTSGDAEVDMHDLMMWSQEEELLVGRPMQDARIGSDLSSLVAMLRNAFLFMAMASAIFGIVQKGVTVKGDAVSPQKF